MALQLLVVPVPCFSSTLMNDDATGAKMSPNTVLFVSIGFIAVVSLLHVFGKLYLARQ